MTISHNAAGQSLIRLLEGHYVGFNREIQTFNILIILIFTVLVREWHKLRNIFW